MLHLLPSVLYNKVSERRSFLQELFLFVLLLHLFLFVVPFLSSLLMHKHSKFTISMHQAGATYVLMPFQKKVSQNSSSMVCDTSNISKKSHVMGYDEYVQNTKKNKKVVQKNNKVDSVSNTKLEKQKIEKKSKQRPHSTAVLADKIYAKKRLASKKIVNSKNKKNLKNNKTKNKIKIIEQKQPEVLKTLQEEAKNQVQQSVQEQSLKVESTVPDILQSSEEISAVSDNVIFIGYEQFDECVIGSKIQHAIIQSWTPPVGLEQGISCEMKIVVSADGAADTIEVVKGSGVLVFDMSARAALQEIEFPKEVQGKTIMLVLGN